MLLGEVEMADFVSESESLLYPMYFYLGVTYGVLIVTLAFMGDNFGDIYQGSYAVTGGPTGVMGGVFIMALFMPFIGKQVKICNLRKNSNENRRCVSIKF